MGLSAGPVTLDPRLATDAVSQRINHLIYEQLVDYDDQQRPVPSLANWEVLSDTHYRFTLGQTGRKFHDGTILTADDVKATYDSVLDPATLSPHRTNLLHIKTIQVLDEQRIDFFLDRPDPQFPGKLVIGIYPEHHLHNIENTVLVIGSGPFRVIEWREESNLVLERIRDGQQFDFLTVKDPTVRVLKLIRGEIDMIQNDLPFELLEWLGSKINIEIDRKSGTTFTYLGFNLRDPALASRSIRLAIAHGINRPNIIKYVFEEAAEPAGSILPPTHWAGHPELRGIDYNPSLARQILRQAGFDKKQPLILEYKTSSNPFRQRLATVIQHQLAQIGVVLELRSHDWGTFYGDIKKGQFQVYSLSWVGLDTPDIFRYAFHSESVPPFGANRAYLEDIQIDKLIESAEMETEQDEQIKHYHRLQERIHHVLPYVPLWYEHNILARQKNIKGYQLAVNGSYDSLITTYREPGL